MNEPWFRPTHCNLVTPTKSCLGWVHSFLLSGTWPPSSRVKSAVALGFVRDDDGGGRARCWRDARRVREHACGRVSQGRRPTGPVSPVLHSISTNQITQLIHVLVPPRLSLAVSPLALLPLILSKCTDNAKHWYSLTFQSIKDTFSGSRAVGTPLSRPPYHKPAFQAALQTANRLFRLGLK